MTDTPVMRLRKAKKTKGEYRDMLSKIGGGVKKARSKIKRHKVLSEPRQTFKFMYLVDYHTPTNPIEYQRINSEGNQVLDYTKMDIALDKMEINLNIRSKKLKGEISEGFKGLFKGQKIKNTFNIDTLKRIDYIKDSFGDAYGPLRLKIDNRVLPTLESTRAIGCFSALDSGLLGYPSLQVVELQKLDVAIFVSSFELWETIGPQEVVQVLSKGLAKKGLEESMTALSSAFNYESKNLKRDAKVNHEAFNAILISL